MTEKNNESREAKKPVYYFDLSLFIIAFVIAMYFFMREPGIRKYLPFWVFLTSIILLWVGQLYRQSMFSGQLNGKNIERRNKND